jgi:hypothetical protein
MAVGNLWPRSAKFPFCGEGNRRRARIHCKLVLVLPKWALYLQFESHLVGQHLSKRVALPARIAAFWALDRAVLRWISVLPSESCDPDTFSISPYSLKLCT